MSQAAPAPDGARTDPLLQPFTLKHLTFRNRIMSTSHACGLAEDAMPAERYQRYHEAKAAGGIALTMFGGSSNVSPDSQWNFPQINLHDERIVEHFQRFSEADPRARRLPHVPGHPRGRPRRALRGGAACAHRSVPTARDAAPSVRAGRWTSTTLRGWWATTPGRPPAAAKAGSTASRPWPVRTSSGSSCRRRRTVARTGSAARSANRCRFGLMVHEAIRKAVGDDFVVGIRFVVDEAG